VKWSEFVGIATVASLVLASATYAEDPERRRIPVRVKVTHLSDQAGGVEPNAREIAEALERNHIRYPSAKVVQEQRFELQIGETGTIKLRDGGALHIQPMDLDARGVHMAVDVDGSTGVEKTDFRVGDDKLVVIDGGPVGDGKRVISIQPDYE
jgi:hypothetical protein